MKNILLFIVVIVLSKNTFAQLNCIESKKETGMEKTCFHKNKKVSTIESWDTNKYWGKIIGYNSKEEKIFHYELRKVAGHASVSVFYHPNGQVSKIDYSSHPDGGIQRYHEVTTYDELGNQTSFLDDSWPDGYPTVTTFTKQFPDTTDYDKKVKKQEVITCAIPYFTYYKVKNETKYPVHIQFVINKNSSYFIKRNNQKMVLKPKEMFVDSVMMAQMYLKQTDAYEVIITNQQPKKKKFKLIFEQPKEPVNNKKSYIWYILEEN